MRRRIQKAVRGTRKAARAACIVVAAGTAVLWWQSYRGNPRLAYRTVAGAVVGIRTEPGRIVLHWADRGPGSLPPHGIDIGWGPYEPYGPPTFGPIPRGTPTDIESVLATIFGRRHEWGGFSTTTLA